MGKSFNSYKQKKGFSEGKKKMLSAEQFQPFFWKLQLSRAIMKFHVRDDHPSPNVFLVSHEAELKI